MAFLIIPFQISDQVLGKTLPYSTDGSKELPTDGASETW